MSRHVVTRIGAVLVLGALALGLSGTAASAAPVARAPVASAAQARSAQISTDAPPAAPAFGHWERTGSHTSSKFLCEKIGQIEWPLFPTDCFQDGGQWWVWVFFPW